MEAAGRAALDAWQKALAGSGLPVAGLEVGGIGRARMSFGAPLPAAASGEGELTDLWLLERRTAWELREALADRLPEAHRWVGAENVWLGAPALAGRIVAADWRVAITGAEAGDRGRLGDAVRAILAARSLPRVRLKGGSERSYDLRPLLAAAAVLENEADPDVRAAVPDRGLTLRIRTRFDPEAGTGRPEEVVAALGEAAGLPLAAIAIIRERLILAADVKTPKQR